MVVMSFGDHIEEFRRRLILALLGLFVGIVVALTPPVNLGRWVVRQMQAPAQRMLEEFDAKEARERIAAAEALGVHVVRYEGADHGFVHDPSRPTHRPDDAADAWRRVIGFLSA